MKFETRIEKEVNGKFWNDLLLKNSSSTIYQTSNFSDVYRKSYDSIPFFLTTLDTNGKIVGQFQFFIHSKYFWNQANPLYQTVGRILKKSPIIDFHYGPIIHDTENYEDILQSMFLILEKIALQNQVIAIQGSSNPSDDNSKFSKILQENHFTIIPWDTYLIDLKQDSQEFFNALDKKIRYDIRKSEKNGVKFEIVNDFENFKEFTKFNRLVKNDKRKPDEKRLHANWELYEKNMLKIFLARLDGKIISGIHNYFFNNHVIQNAVANDLSSKEKSGSFLTWNTIKWCMKENYLVYDMGGANPSPIDEKEKNISYYKSKWNTKSVSYLKFSKILDSSKWKLVSILKNPRRIYGR